MFSLCSMGKGNLEERSGVIIRNFQDELRKHGIGGSDSRRHEAPWWLDFQG